jgi:U3 small nucleolar RNA-associated protein 10
MLRNTDLARFVAALLPDSIKEGYCHRTLVAFNAATFHDFITRSKSLDEGTLAFLLPALLQPLQARLGAAAPTKDEIVSPLFLGLVPRCLC